MSIYDAYIPKIAEYITDLRAKGRQIREFRCPSDVGQLLEGVPVRVGPGASQGIILRSDTFAEIGNPEAGSAAFLLWTDNPSLVNDGKITLIGPDIPESPDASLPFGQVLIVAGSGLTEKDHQTLEHTQFVADRIEGYMIRSVAQVIWSRVSKEAAAKGFCFESLGKSADVHLQDRRAQNTGDGNPLRHFRQGRPGAARHHGRPGEQDIQEHAQRRLEGQRLRRLRVCFRIRLQVLPRPAGVR